MLRPFQSRSRKSQRQIRVSRASHRHRRNRAMRMRYISSAAYGLCEATTAPCRDAPPVCQDYRRAQCRYREQHPCRQHQPRPDHSEPALSLRSASLWVAPNVSTPTESRHCPRLRPPLCHSTRAGQPASQPASSQPASQLKYSNTVLHVVPVDILYSHRQ